MTADINSAVDMAQIDIIKKAVAIANKSRVNKKRVVLRGRKPIVKARFVNNLTGKVRIGGFDRAGNIYGGIRNASKLDVYIYDRY